MKRFLVIFLMLCSAVLLVPEIKAQGEMWASGLVLEEEGKEALVGAVILVKENNAGVVSGGDGSFRIKIEERVVEIQVRYLGYHDLDTVLSYGEEQTFYLRRNPFAQEEVVVVADEKSLVHSVEMGKVSLSRYEMEHLPRLLGEADPIRFLQLTPGVQSSSEGGIGFYVRGGGVDQNLVLYDDATVYNPGHLLGFVSVFNPDIISELSLMKAGIPARFGGRLSSVIRVLPERGASDSLKISGQIGLVASRLSMQRSFHKDRGSFILSARRASIDLFVKPVIFPLLADENLFLQESSYHFYDFSGALSYRVGEGDFLDFSAFYGKDRYAITRSERIAETNMDWGNFIWSAKWRHFFSEYFVLQTSVSKTNYHFDLGGAQHEYVFSLLSSVDDYKGKLDFSYYGGQHQLKFGMELMQHTFVPNEIDVLTGALKMNFMSYQSLFAYEGGIYVEDKFSLSDHLDLSIGLRYSFFNQVGPYTEYIYDAGGYLADSISFANGDGLALYHRPEPRATIKYTLGDDASLKASFMHMAQYIHLATSSTVSLPTDIWLPSSRDVVPQYGNQYSIGYFKELMGGKLEASLEVYYKNARNQIEFTRGVLTSSLSMSLEDNIVVGKGRSYGAEFFVRKRSGVFTAWAGYTLARSSRTFEMLNDGRVYPAKTDRRHDISIAGIYEHNEQWNFSFAFVYVSGNAFTLPIGRYVIQGNLVNEYGELNNFRMPAYHRLDISATRGLMLGRARMGELDISIYNLYSRANPFYIYFETSGDVEDYRLEVKPVIVSLFPIIPSVSWRFEF